MLRLTDEKRKYQPMIGPSGPVSLQPSLRARPWPFLKYVHTNKGDVWPVTFSGGGSGVLQPD